MNRSQARDQREHAAASGRPDERALTENDRRRCMGSGSRRSTLEAQQSGGHLGIEYGMNLISVAVRLRYTPGVHKTTLQVDEDLVARAGAILGTRGLKATVQRALEEVVAREARRRFGQRLQAMDGLELDNPALIAGAWH